MWAGLLLKILMDLEGVLGSALVRLAALANEPKQKLAKSLYEAWQQI
jgi:hypothetical protein